MAKRVGFDYGHGGTDPGAVYKGRKESNDVLKVGMKTATIMRNHGVGVDETRTTDKTLSLRERSNFLNRKKYDYVVSFHRNSAKSVATGVEVFAHPQSNAKSKALSKRMNDELVKVGFVNRGAKTANFHMLREVRAYSVLPELGFINNPKDNKLFDDNIDKIAEAIAKSLLAEMGITYKGTVTPAPKPSTPNSNVYYGVGSPHNTKSGVQKLQKDLVILGYSVGSYGADGVMGSDTKGAILKFQKANGLKQDGFAGQATLNKITQLIAEKNKPKPIVPKSNPPNKSDGLYKVQVGAYANKNNADKLLKDLESKGFKGFIKKE